MIRGVAEWIQCFNEGRTSFEDLSRSDRPVTEATDRNIEVIRALIDENPHINSIIHDAFKIKKLCAR